VVCGGIADGEKVSDVWRLDLATLRWEPMPSLLSARDCHACCAVRDDLGGRTEGRVSSTTSSVEMFSEEKGEFVNLPPLSCGGIFASVAIEVEESDSAAGKVLLIRGSGSSGRQSALYLVNLATGACALQPAHFNNARYYHAAARLQDVGGRIVCAGGDSTWTSAEAPAAVSLSSVDPYLRARRW
jgi:hypothetical protein